MKGAQTHAGNPAFAVIFDFDGLIVDSETPEFEAHRQIFAEHGVTLTAEEWLEEVGTYSPDRNWFERLGRRLELGPITEGTAHEVPQRHAQRILGPRRQGDLTSVGLAAASPHQRPAEAA
ncbi:MAG: hypothetical protein N2689_16885, partial [Verrucomicrobiae bacterium]|nr:hypothetical protein [Verrucomicrobiae bacterium]